MVPIVLHAQEAKNDSKIKTSVGISSTAYPVLISLMTGRFPPNFLKGWGRSVPKVVLDNWPVVRASKASPLASCSARACSLRCSKPADLSCRDSIKCPAVRDGFPPQSPW